MTNWTRLNREDANPSLDSGWGLIFRLNDLWRDVENLAPAGKYSQWNFKLDRIYSNLLYRIPFEIKKNENGDIVDIKLSEDDISIKRFIDKRILIAQGKMNRALKLEKGKKEEDKDMSAYLHARRELYDMVFLKEVWLRKLMHENKLYIKEISHNPATAMWGGR